MSVRIVFVNRYFFPDESATSQFTSDVAFDLARAGHDVHVIASRQVYQDPSQRLPAEETIAGVHVHRIWTTHRGRMRVRGLALDYLTFYLSCAWRLWRLIGSDWIVVARTDPPVVSVVAWLIVRWRGATLVTWLADLFPEIATELGLPGGTGRLGQIVRSLRNRSLAAAATNVVLGESMRAYLVREGIPGARIRVVRDWADGCRIRPVPKRQNPLAIDWDLVDRFVVGYSGNMGRAHRFDTIVGAIAAMRQRTDTRFLFIGAGVRHREIVDAVAARGLENVVFRPYQPRESLGYSLAVPDVHLISLNPNLEGFIVPSKFYSAAAAGRPAIYVGDPSGDIAELLTTHHCGIAVREGDVDGLAAAIDRLRDDPALYRTMADNARRLFERAFDQPIALAAWRDVIERIGAREGAAA